MHWRESESIENPWRESKGSQRVRVRVCSTLRVRTGESESIESPGVSQKGVREYTNHWRESKVFKNFKERGSNSHVFLLKKVELSL